MNFSQALFAGLGLGLIVTSLWLANDNNRLSAQVETVTKQTQKISKENQAIAKQNRAYSRCIATIFAQYTHDFIPITILDLDTCTIDGPIKASGDTGGGQQSANQPVQPSTLNAVPNTSPPSPTLLDRVGQLFQTLIKPLML